ncbi:MAG: cytochrome ubiquinol oxidase subunit I [Acidiferrobacterales bacterium]|nr:cytochrome ubiquinol oxidase subunit I [Acidiferrobacterales bacterium]
MEFDPFLLSRIQFALNISFHILFPTISIGLAYYLLFFRIRITQTGNQHWEFIYAFWVKVFALTFALGVVTGIVMSFQFGTNWPGFMEQAGNIAGPLLGYEVLTAFFLEASFLGIMLFGKSKVSNRLHLISTAVVAIGTTLSAFWILSLNSWMQTPTGYVIENGEMIAESWLAIIFNPSFPYRFAHMMVASLITASFLVAGVSAYRVLKKVDGPATNRVLKVAILAATILTPTQVIIGDLHGLNTFEHQPAKVAALEGIWETQTGAPLTLFGFPNEETRQTDFAIKVPKLGSLILAHDWNAEIIGLNDFEGQHPPVAPVFWSFRIMVGTGVLMLVVAWFSCFQLWRNKTLTQFNLRVLYGMTFSGWVAVLAGWYVTEIGRQPWVVQGLISTADVVADHKPAVLITSLTAYVLMYLFLLVSYIGAIFYLSSKPAQSLTRLHNYGMRAIQNSEVRGV